VAKLRFKISMSLDGFIAGPSQSLQNPLGIGAERLHKGAFELAAFRAVHGMTGGEVNASGGSSKSRSPASAPRSWDATCSASIPDPGTHEIRGMAGGASIPLPSPGVRFHASCPLATEARGRDDLHIRKRWYRGGPRPGLASRLRQGCLARRRCQSGPAIPRGGGWWMRWKSISYRHFSVAVSACSMVSAITRTDLRWFVASAPPG
jgi:hypothetical protein